MSRLCGVYGRERQPADDPSEMRELFFVDLRERLESGAAKVQVGAGGGQDFGSGGHKHLPLNSGGNSILYLFILKRSQGAACSFGGSHPHRTVGGSYP
jgi:hypothetical protein